MPLSAVSEHTGSRLRFRLRRFSLLWHRFHTILCSIMCVFTRLGVGPNLPARINWSAINETAVYIRSSGSCWVPFAPFFRL